MTGIVSAIALKEDVPDGEPYERISELRQILLDAQHSFQIWWACSNREDRQRYKGALNKHSVFFAATLDAHFTVTMISLAKLYEKKPKTVNIDQALSSRPGLCKVLSQQLTEAKLIGHKVCILRNNLYAHTDYKLDYGAAFLKADLTPDEIRKLVELSKQIVNAISYAHDKTCFAFDLDNFTHETYRLLDSLSRDLASKGGAV